MFVCVCVCVTHVVIFLQFCHVVCELLQSVLQRQRNDNASFSRISETHEFFIRTSAAVLWGLRTGPGADPKGRPSLTEFREMVVQTPDPQIFYTLP